MSWFWRAFQIRDLPIMLSLQSIRDGAINAFVRDEEERFPSLIDLLKSG